MADTVTINVTETAETVTINVSQYNVPTPTAESDFMVANATPGWVKKTLAQVKTILGLGTAAYTAATDYVTHDLATAVNDFIVASGAGVYVKKTLAEVKTILGLGTAAYTAATDYVTHALATAANDFLIASGAGVVVKKTLAETQAILTNAFQTEAWNNGGTRHTVDATTYKDWKLTVTADCTHFVLANTSDGDAGMIELLIDVTGGYTVTLNGWNKQLGATNLVTTANTDNFISWRNVSGSLVYTIQQAE